MIVRYYIVVIESVNIFHFCKLNCKFLQCTGVTGLHDSLARVLTFQFCNLALTSIYLIDRPLFVIYEGGGGEGGRGGGGFSFRFL